MAAGRGKRLGTLTTDFPKALIEVAGAPLVGHSLRFARWVGCDPRVVVGGFCFDQLEAAVRELDPEATIVENTQLHAGNLLSLTTGLAAIPAEAGFLLMNADHIYPEPVARVVRAAADQASEITAFCDFDRPLGDDDMKVSFDERGCVAAMSKKLEEFDGGYVGMTWVPASCRARYDEAIAKLRADEGDNNPVERVLARLAEAGTPPTHADISGHRWFEIDEPHEREQAEQEMKA